MEPMMVFEKVVVPSAPVPGTIVERNGYMFDFRDMTYSVVIYDFRRTALQLSEIDALDYPHGLD